MGILSFSKWLQNEDYDGSSEPSGTSWEKAIDLYNDPKHGRSYVYLQSGIAVFNFTTHKGMYKRFPEINETHGDGIKYIVHVGKDVIAIAAKKGNKDPQKVLKNLIRWFSKRYDEFDNFDATTLKIETEQAKNGTATQAALLNVPFRQIRKMAVYAIELLKDDMYRDEPSKTLSDAFFGTYIHGQTINKGKKKPFSGSKASICPTCGKTNYSPRLNKNKTMRNPNPIKCWNDGTIYMAY